MDELTPEQQQVADLLWEAAHGAPPTDRDPIWTMLFNADRFNRVIRALGCTCSPGVPDTDTDWWTDPECSLHGSQLGTYMVSPTKGHTIMSTQIPDPPQPTDPQVPDEGTEQESDDQK